MGQKKRAFSRGEGPRCSLPCLPVSSSGPHARALSSRRSNAEKPEYERKLKDQVLAHVPLFAQFLRMTSKRIVPHAAAVNHDGLGVAFQGEPGAFSEEAVTAFFGEAAEPVPFEDFRGAAQSVAVGRAACAVLPVENSLAGTVVAAYDALAAAGLEIMAEITRPIRLCLMARPGGAVEALREVRSHPVALAQCGRFLQARPHLRPVATYDTAGAAAEVRDAADAGVGAIAAGVAAARYGLEILAEDIQDREDNQTRFYVVATSGTKLPAPRAPVLHHKTALFADTPDRPGALYALLEPFARDGVNLTKLESRPGGTPWTYRFLLELTGSADQPPLATALTAARGIAREVHVLGSFPCYGMIETGGSYSRPS